MSFEFDGDPPELLVQALRAHAFETLAQLNLCLEDLVTPAMLFQVGEHLPDNQIEVTISLNFEVRDRRMLDDKILGDFLMDIAHFLSDPSYGPKYPVALELYAAHFTEQQVRVRFILLVIAMEALTQSSNKDPVALGLVNQWSLQLDGEIAKHCPSTAAYRDLNSLSGQLTWLRGDSIGVQIANLFADFPGASADEIGKLKKQARALYEKRSRLVQGENLPVDELPGLEKEARILVEKLFRSAIAKSRSEDDRFRIECKDRGPESDGDDT